MTRTCRDGELVADRFRIVRFVAQGGMGEVYEAADQMLGERVALKFLSRRILGDPDIVRRFRREVQLARKVTHPNVCRLHDVYHHATEGGLGGPTDLIFVTMEMLAGETLEERLGRDGAFSEPAAFELAVQMAAALDAAHEAGVVHRDFKTSNVMLTPRSGGERAVVTDFGLARSFAGDTDATRLTGDARMLGTPDTMAPEQLRGEAAGPRADIYALGVVLFEMVTAKRPYEAENTMSLLVKRVSEAPRSPRSFVPTLSERFEAVIMRCLENRPEDRYATPTDVVAALSDVDPEVVRRWTAPLPSLVHHYPSGESAAVTSDSVAGQRRWLVPAALAVIVVAALALWRLGDRRPSGLQTSTLSPIQLTTAPGLELDPSFSPDGGAMVYSCDESGAFELYVQDLAPGGTQSQLTFGGSQAFEPAWSPDGRVIAYHARAAGGIWRLPSSGGEAERLTTFGSRPAFSPDATRIVFQSESIPALADTSAPALARSQLWLLDLRGGEPRPITESGLPAGGHAAPSWSPDGRRIVFTASQRGRSELWTLDLESRRVAVLVREPGSASDPVHSTSGDAVFFSASARQVSGLWRIAVSRRTGEPLGEPQQIANVGLASIRQLALDPAGKRAAYSALVTTSNLQLLRLDGAGRPTGPSSALTSGSGRNNRAVFSPDGGRLVYDHWRLGVNIDLWVMELASGQTRQLTTDEFSNAQASWYPDGEAVMFNASRDGVFGLWRLDLATSAIELVSRLEADVDWARLSPDGTRIAYHARGNGTAIDVWVRPVAGGAPQRVTAARELAGFPVWSPDGELLAYQLKRGDDAHVMVVPAAGGEPQQLTAGPGQSWPFGFSPDGDKVVFAGQRADGWNVWWVSRSSGETRQLTDLGSLGRYVRYPSWSPTGKRIVFELAETVGDIWLLDNIP